MRQFGSTIIWAGVAIYLIHELAATTRAFAGRASAASFIVDLAAHLNASVVGSVSVAGVTSILWANEYRRHRKTRERLTGRITMLELKIDPNRSSSGLTTQGTTHSRDL